MEPEPGRRERKKLETRRALVAAAQQLARERGPDHVTVEEIADAADVSVRTFFNYFGAKEDAIVGMDPSVVEAVGTALQGRPADESPLEALRNVMAPPGAEIELVAEWWIRRASLVRTYPSLLPRHLAAMAELERSMHEAIVARIGGRATELYAAVVVSCAVGTFRRTIGMWEAAGRTGDLAGDVAAAFDLLANGLVPPADRTLAAAT